LIFATPFHSMPPRHIFFDTPLITPEAVADIDYFRRGAARSARAQKIYARVRRQR
jgi:hypothetical protein